MTASIHELMTGDVSRPVAAALESLDSAIVAALEAAKDRAVPQGLIVAVMHAHAHRETADMLGLP